MLITKPVLLLVNKLVPYNSKNLVKSQRENQNFA